ncbi:MAG: DUF1559 domain-containing protein [Gemmataceae bacterium]
MRSRHGFTLIELLVVIAIVGVLLGLLLPAVQRVREAANRVKCQSNLKEMGLALHSFHDSNGFLPPGMITDSDLQDCYHTGFSYLLPYLEQGNLYQLIQMDQHWYDLGNYTALEQQVPIFYCPSNRTSGVMDLTAVIEQWSAPMPPYVGSCDYILCKGANSSLRTDTTLIPPEARGLFNESRFASGFAPGGGASSLPMPQQAVRFAHILDGLSTTMAIGEGAGGSPYYYVADYNNLSQPTLEPFVNGPAQMEQGWGAASVGDLQHPWYAGILGVTAQIGYGPNPMDEPMNRRPGMPTILASEGTRFTVTGFDLVSGFRSMHMTGCNFLFADGSVRFVPQSIDPAVYRALSSYAGCEVISGADF